MTTAYSGSLNLKHGGDLTHFFGDLRPRPQIESLPAGKPNSCIHLCNFAPEGVKNFEGLCSCKDSPKVHHNFLLEDACIA